MRRYAILALALSACAPSTPTPAAGPSIAPDDFALPALPAPSPISQAEYASRRAGVAAAMEAGVFVAFGSSEPDLDFLPYGQNSFFRYLTGITEPGAGLILVKTGSGLEEILFVRPRNPEREIWEGTRLGTEGATALTGIRALPGDRLVTTLDSLVATHGALHSLVPLLPDATRDETLSREQQILRSVLQKNPETRLVPIAGEVQALRARKSSTEIDLIRRATLISTLAHREAMRSLEPGMNEFEIRGLVEYIFTRSGAERPAYVSIVGSGPNATTLHYRAADRFMNAGELMLMDVGASYRGYASDVTRTMPVSGRFSPEQREVYQIVLNAQKAAENQIRVGATWADLEGAAARVLAEGLTRLGLIDAPDATYHCQNPQANDLCPQFRLYYMHSLGHAVGLDVHDSDVSYGGSVQPGSVFTLEPGMYVRADALDFLRDSPQNRAMIERLRPALERYRDIGVRTEDMYLVTERGYDRLSAGAPREIAEVEATMMETGLGERFRRPDVVEWYRATSPR